MFDFEKISLNQIITFSEIISDSSLMEIEFVESKYQKNATNFDITIEFLREIGLITIKHTKIIPRKSYVSFLANWKQEHELVQNYIIKHFIGPRNSFYEYLADFFSLFRKSDDVYEYSPTISLRLKYSGIRNFLMELEVLCMDRDNKKYVVAKNYFDVFKRLNKINHIALDDFLANLKNRERIGNLAEKEILQYEKERLANLPSLAYTIEHISIEDTAAGYDIKSYEDVLDKQNKPILRYIEVKAVSPWKYKFYWTRNEIEKAKIYRRKYYLYLLPVIGKNKFDVQALKIIRDPYLHTYQNRKEWTRRIELLTFSLQQ